MFKKPTQKTVVGQATKIGAGVIGAKLSDGVAAVMPESTNSYKKGAIAVAALVGAACIDTKTTAGEVTQAALVGMAIKQGSDAVTDLLVPAIDQQDNSKTTGKFINAVVGHNAETITQPAPVSAKMLNSSYSWNAGTSSTERAVPVSLPTANKAPLGV